MSAVPTPPAADAGPKPVLRRVVDPQQARRARGEPMLWLCGGALAMCLLMITGLLALVVWQGCGTFWPTAAVQMRLLDGSLHLGEIARDESYRPSPEQLAELPAEVRGIAGERVAARGGAVTRHLVRTGNFELSGEHFRWIPDHVVAETTTPEWALVIERQEWGRFYGLPTALLVDGQAVATAPAEIMARFSSEHGPARDRFRRIDHLRKHDIGRISEREEDARLHARAVELRHGAGSAQHAAALAELATTREECAAARAEVAATIDALGAENARYALQVRTAAGQEKALALAEIVRAYAPNRLSLGEQASVYLDRWGEFLFDEPRESNTEGGVWPAIFGTVLMTLIMSLLVVPLGVLAALYMREYAKAGLVISAVRVAVNNLAGVPSIVFGVFGLGFFCYIVGGSIDSLFYPERLPSPTFGKGALIWASLTLALLTLPVVIVSTEEALAAVPSSMREGSYACGASKWQTIRRIVLPRAMPGIMTGMILAMARGAGEVAPLMLVGAVKLAPDLPLDTEGTLLHPSRSFMHLGFHVYDLGFQSQNSEASKPMVFTTTLLLIGIITMLNVTAVWLRSRLRRRFAGAQF